MELVKYSINILAHLISKCGYRVYVGTLVSPHAAAAHLPPTQVAIRSELARYLWVMGN